MARPIAIFLMLFASFNSLGQDANSFATQKEIIDIINWKIQTDKVNPNLTKIKRLNRHIDSWDSTDIDFLSPDSLFYKGLIVKMKRLDTVFSKSDFAYINQQLSWQLNRKQTWRKWKLIDIKIINSKFLNALKLNRPYWEYSVPIFSENHSLFIMKYNYHCGLLCASWRTGLFRKTPNGWKEIMILYGLES